MNEFVKIADISIRCDYFAGEPTPIRIAPLEDNPGLRFRASNGRIEIWATADRAKLGLEGVLCRVDYENPDFLAAADVQIKNPESTLFLQAETSGSITVNSSHLHSLDDLLVILEPEGVVMNAVQPDEPHKTAAQGRLYALKNELRLALGVLAISKEEGVDLLEATFVLPAAEAHWRYHITGTDVDGPLFITSDQGETFIDQGMTELPDGRAARVLQSPSPIKLLARPVHMFALGRKGALGAETVIPALPAAALSSLTTTTDTAGNSQTVANIYIFI